jgi:hypothetical protein
MEVNYLGGLSQPAQRGQGGWKAIKKRPELFSSGRLGSPPPELPNHEMDTSELPIECKRHFGNGILPGLGGC